MPKFAKFLYVEPTQFRIEQTDQVTGMLNAADIGTRKDYWQKITRESKEGEDEKKILIFAVHC